MFTLLQVYWGHVYSTDLLNVVDKVILLSHADFFLCYFIFLPRKSTVCLYIYQMVYWYNKFTIFLVTEQKPGGPSHRWSLMFCNSSQWFFSMKINIQRDKSILIIFIWSFQTACTLTSTGQVDVGVHVFELMLEDFSTKNITLTYADGTSTFQEPSDTNSSPLCKVKLQFSVESKWFKRIKYTFDRVTQLDRLSDPKENQPDLTW